MTTSYKPVHGNGLLSLIEEFSKVIHQVKRDCFGMKDRRGEGGRWEEGGEKWYLQNQERGAKNEKRWIIDFTLFFRRGINVIQSNGIKCSYLVSA